MNGKFKVWDSKNKKFVDEEHFCILCNGELGYFNTHMELDCFPRDGFVPVYSTGLSDKNGVDIYEGDILKRNQSEYHISTNIREVIYYDGCWRLRSKNWNKSIPMPELSKEEINLRINIRIGNKFENPELLE